MLKNMSGVAFANLLSRILGLVRDVLFAAVLGGGSLMSAWVYVFLIPNLFRRILGEGALGNALIPLLVDSLNKDESRKKTASDFFKITVFLGGGLGAFSILVALISIICSLFVESTRLKLVFEILPVVIPYSMLICVTGIAGVALNCLKKFFFPALTSLALNIFLIFALYFFIPLLISPFSILFVLACSVILAGVSQLGIMFYLLWKERLVFFGKLTMPRELLKDAFIREVFKLALPGILGAGALQISLFIDKTLALTLGDYAVPALYYSDRIVFITIGIFAVSLTGVMLPNMSAYAVKQDYDGLKIALTTGLRHMLFICIPAAVFTYLFRFEIIRVLFMRGAFDKEALQETAFALGFYSLGIPFFATVKILLSGFYSRKKMTLPVKISVFCIFVNIVLNIILMQFIRQGGIALATVIASVLNNIILFYFLYRELNGINMMNLIKSIFNIIVSASGAGYVSVYYFSNITGHLLSVEVFLISLAVFSMVYVLISGVFASEELNDWCGVFHKV